MGEQASLLARRPFEDVSLRWRLLLVLPFLLFFYWQLAHHVMWRDEINPWAIACNSASLRDLLHRVHYEAHPALWYVLLWLASKLTHGVWMMKVIQGAIGTAIFLLLAFTTPFRRVEQVLIYASFYISFEYTVMARMYGIEVVCALVYIWFRMTRPTWVVWNVLWLCLMANVDSTAAVLATGLLIEYLWSLLRSKQADVARIAVAVAMYAVALMICVATLWPAKDLGWSSTGKLGHGLLDPEHWGVALALWGGLAWFPQTISPIAIWSDLRPWPHALLVPIALVLLALALWRHRGERWLYATVLLLAIGFSQITSVAAVRHIGMMYITFLLCVWRLRFRGAAVSWASYALLGLAVLANVQWLWAERGHPFADDDDAARWMVAQHWDALPLLASPDTETIGVPIRLNRPVYQLDCKCSDRILLFSNRRDAFNTLGADRDAQFAPRSSEGMNALGANTSVLLTNMPLTQQQLAAFQQERLRVDLGAAFNRGLLPDEHFYVYKLTR